MTSGKLPYGITAVAVLGLVALAYASQGWIRPVTAGAEAPDIRYPDLRGEEIALSELRGQVVLVNVWATWCGPCRVEMPSMQRLYEEMSDDGFQILAVSIDAAPGERDASGNIGGDVRAFVEEYGLTFPILLDPAGTVQRTYQTTGVPESFLVDGDGVIRRKVAGGIEWDTPALKEQVRGLLEEARRGS